MRESRSKVDKPLLNVHGGVPLDLNNHAVPFMSLPAQSPSHSNLHHPVPPPNTQTG